MLILLFESYRSLEWQEILPRVEGLKVEPQTQLAPRTQVLSQPNAFDLLCISVFISLVAAEISVWWIWQ